MRDWQYIMLYITTIAGHAAVYNLKKERERTAGSFSILRSSDHIVCIYVSVRGSGWRGREPYLKLIVGVSNIMSWLLAAVNKNININTQTDMYTHTQRTLWSLTAPHTYICFLTGLFYLIVALWKVTVTYYSVCLSVFLSFFDTHL